MKTRSSYRYRASSSAAIVINPSSVFHIPLKTPVFLRSRQTLPAQHCRLYPAFREDQSGSRPFDRNKNLSAGRRRARASFATERAANRAFNILFRSEV